MHASVETTAPILVDKVQIQQVLVNLVRNAIDAMEASARKVLSIRVAESGGMVEVSVSDTGSGLSPDIADRLFEPFATTKSQGMGIGLSVCRTIIEAHGGRIWAEPGSAGGTTFRFAIPSIRQETQEQERKDVA